VIAPVEVFMVPKDPCAGEVLIANFKGSAGLSGSVPVSVILFIVPWVAETFCGLAVGVPATTLSVTLAGALLLVPLLTVNVKLSVPLKPSFGVYVTAPVDAFNSLSLPFEGDVAMAKVKGKVGTSGSPPVRVIAVEVPRMTDNVCG
jgi:hypothetical protein